MERQGGRAVGDRSGRLHDRAKKKIRRVDREGAALGGEAAASSSSQMAKQKSWPST